VLGCALAVALHAGGHSLRCVPGAPVSFHRGERQVEPFGVLEALGDGRLSATEWQATCEAFEIAEWTWGGWRDRVPPCFWQPGGKMPRALVVFVVVLSTVACGMMAFPERRGDDRPLPGRSWGVGVAAGDPPGLGGAVEARVMRHPPSDLDGLDFEPATADALRKTFLEMKLEWIRGNWPADGNVTFVTWLADIPGPGHQARGFTWARSRPGASREPRRASFEEYTPVEGNWYLSPS